MRFISAALMVAAVAAIDLTKSSKRQASESSSSSSSSSSSDQEDTFLMLTSGGFYKVQDIGTGSLDKKYERVVPEHFSAGSDDLFMKSMIMNYSDEGKDCDKDSGECKPNGQFTMTEAATRAAPLRFSDPTRVSRVPPVPNISRTTSREPGLTSMSTRTVESVLRLCLNS